MCKLILHTEYTDATHIDGLVNRQDDITSSLEREIDGVWCWVRGARMGQ
jgi:hypothetical protein